MVLGLGSGATAELILETLAARVAQGLTKGASPVRRSPVFRAAIEHDLGSRCSRNDGRDQLRARAIIDCASC
jgi:hypothetical protein